MDDMAQRRLDAVSELSYQEAQRRGLDDRSALWVVQAGKTALIREGSAWRALQVATEYAERLAEEAK